MRSQDRKAYNEEKVEACVNLKLGQLAKNGPHKSLKGHKHDRKAY